MRKSWLLCVLLGTMAWGQAPSGQTPAPSPGPGQAPNAAGPTTPAAEVPESAVVLTIHGVCPAAPIPAASKTAASKVATSPVKKPADCTTKITRAEFEKIASGLSPTVTPQLKRQLATVLPKFMAMSEAAKAKGLDKSSQYQETLKVVKMQILTQQLQRSVQEEADKVPPQEIEDYYKKNPEAYEQFSLERLFIPRNKQETAEKNNGEKLTDEQEKAKEAADKTKQEEGEQELTKLADSLRARAAAGEDFTKLQKEAFEAAGMKMDSPTVTMPPVRRTGLPQAHAAVFDLKQGEVSQVMTDNGGHYIYKVISKETLPLEKVTEEIRNTLKTQRMKDMMDKYNNSYHAETNEAYFGPPGPTGPGGRPGLGQGASPRMRPQTPPPPTPQAQPQSAPPAANPPSQPPAQQAPPSKPN
ncbi:MAG TPA: peptidyl-prolyl cis-trans isomerase [Candidatus Acidoferrales bacterium]|nr:peptidyl-prolyl cis-trans isomerase [Candidatus Acidoferrales bacterium]